MITGRIHETIIVHYIKIHTVAEYAGSGGRVIFEQSHKFHFQPAYIIQQIYQFFSIGSICPEVGGGERGMCVFAYQVEELVVGLFYELLPASLVCRIL